MVTLRSNIADLLDPSFRAIFFKSLELEPVYSKIFNVMSSKQKTEKLSRMAGFGLPATKNESGLLTYDDPVQMYDKSFTHTTTGLAFRVSKEAYDDDLSGALKKLPAELANSCKAGLETVHAQIFDRSQSGSYTGPDGKVLCATDHPIIGGTYSNRPSTNADLSVTVLEEAITKMRETTNDRGIVSPLKPRTLLIPPALKWMAIQLLQNEEKSGTTNRDINATKGEGLQYLVWDYLTDTDAWYLLTDKESHQLISFMREPIDMDSDTDFDTKDGKFSAMYRNSNGWVDSRGVYGSVGA